MGGKKETDSASSNATTKGKHEKSSKSSSKQKAKPHNQHSKKKKNLDKPHDQEVSQQSEERANTMRRTISFALGGGAPSQEARTAPVASTEGARSSQDDPTMATKLFSIHRLSARFSRNSGQADKSANEGSNGKGSLLRRSLSFTNGMLALTSAQPPSMVSPPRPEAAPVTAFDLAAHHVLGAGLNLFKGLTSVSGGNNLLSYGVSHTIGRRGYMEDRFLAEPTFGLPNTKQSLFGVFDGHGGEIAAQYCADNIPVHVKSNKNLSSDPCMALTQAFERTDQDFCALAASEFLDDGTTAVVAFVRDGAVWCANAGDSRCVLSRGAIAVPLSEDHKPNRPDERKRIVDAGGFVKHLGVWRTQGILAVSRAVGDLSLKRYVIPTPELIKLDLTDADEFLVLASDGVWDVMTNQEVVDMLHSRPNLLLKPELAARAIVTESFRRGSFDNITAVVVVLKPQNSPDLQPEKSSRRRKSACTSVESISEYGEVDSFTLDLSASTTSTPTPTPLLAPTVVKPTE